MSAQGWFLRGVVSHRQKALVDARAAFLRATELDPKHLQARLALAAVCIELGDTSSALVPMQEAVLLAPGDAQILFSLAVAQETNGLQQEALSGYERALALQPRHVGALLNRGALLLAQGRVDDAVANNRQLVAASPYTFEAQFAFGESLLARYDHAAAASAFGRALTLSPRNAKAMLFAGFALSQCERFADAQRLLDEAYAVDPALVRDYRRSIFKDSSDRPLCARLLFLLRHYEAAERCDWREHTHFIKRFSELIRESGAPPLDEKALGFRAMVMGVPQADQLLLARQISARVEQAISAVRTDIPTRTTPTPADASRRIRIAYISTDLRGHPVGLLAESLFALHDRKRFEVIVYLLTSDDGSDICRHIRQGCDEYASLADCSNAETVARIVADRIDVLVDLNGYVHGSRAEILACRPAPLQVSWMAYMTTMGASWIDYFVGDGFSLPEGRDQFFSEALIRLPAGVYMCSYANRTLPPAPEREVFGLPADALVLGAMHNAYKIDPDCFAVWMRLLSRFPQAVLWLLDSNQTATENLRRQAMNHGVDSHRIILAPKVPHADHLVRLQHVDLALDTPQCNGGTTTADMLVAGVPVLTCAGGTLIQRMAGSLLKAAGLDELVVESLGAYEAAAIRLMENAPLMDEAHLAIARARDEALFFHPQNWVRHFEAGLVEAWKRRCHGLPPAAITVTA